MDEEGGEEGGRERGGERDSVLQADKSYHFVFLWDLFQDTSQILR